MGIFERLNQMSHRMLFLIFGPLSIITFYSEKRKFVQFFGHLFKKINPNYRYDCQ